MSTFFTGCTHFGHKNIIKLANRPFDSVDEMDEEMIRRWNEDVTNDDTVYHLGDFSWWKSDVDYRQYLNGKIIHIRGNHDSNATFKMKDYLEISENGVRFVLFHYPIEEWNGWYKNNVLHLHCHTHKHDRWSAEKRYNVTVEANEYRPVPINKIIQEAKEGRFIT